MGLIEKGAYSQPEDLNNPDHPLLQWGGLAQVDAVCCLPIGIESSNASVKVLENPWQVVGWLLYHYTLLMGRSLK